MELLLEKVVEDHTYSMQPGRVDECDAINKKHADKLKLIRRGFGNAENLQIPENDGLSYNECFDHHIGDLFDFVKNPKVISKEDMNKICDKYELTISDHKHYKGTVPLRIEGVLDSYYEVIKKFGSIGTYGINWDDAYSHRDRHRYTYVTDYSQEAYNPWKDEYRCNYKLKFYTGLYILAPHEMFEIPEPISKDPALFVKVRMEHDDNDNWYSEPHYLMLASWGPEQFIPELQSPKSN